MEEGRDARAEDTGILGDNFFGTEILPAKLREDIFEGSIFLGKRNSSRNFVGRNFGGIFFVREIFPAILRERMLGNQEFS
jgi:hypothetical protein